MPQTCREHGSKRLGVGMIFGWDMLEGYRKDRQLQVNLTQDISSRSHNSDPERHLEPVFVSLLFFWAVTTATRLTW